MREWEPILSIPLPFPFPSSPNVSNVKPILSLSLSPTLSLSPFSLFQMSPILKSIRNQTDPNEQFKKSIGRPHFPTCTRSTNFPQVVSVKSGVSQHKDCLHRLATGKHQEIACSSDFSSWSRFAEEKPRKSDGGSGGGGARWWSAVLGEPPVGEPAEFYPGSSRWPLAAAPQQLVLSTVEVAAQGC